MSNIKKHIIAVAVLAASASAAQAATSVTMYGRIDVGYEKSTGDFSTDPAKKGLIQSSAGELRIGFKGSEDLGNGMAATFQLEGRFDADTGTKSVNRSLFDRESTVGLKFNLGKLANHVRIGRSISALEQGISFVDVGRRASAADTYYSASRHSNGLFINHTYGNFTFGGDVATKGGYNDGPAKIGGVDNSTLANEGVAKESIAWGAFAKYKANGLEVGAAYQADNANKLTNPTLKTSGQNVDREWGIGAAYTYKMITAGASYAAGRGDGALATRTDKYKTRVWGGFVSAKVTPNDAITLVYRQNKKQNDDIASGATLNSTKTNKYAIGYVHTLSKRTSVYADFGRINSTVYKYATVNPTTTKTHQNTFDIALRHSF